MKVFLPCRAGSQRILQKNTRPFAGNEKGLLGHKLEQLIRCSTIDDIIVSTNDPEVISIASSMGSTRISIDRRPESLCGNDATTDQLIKYAVSLFSDEHFLWTHVTCPFFDHTWYAKAIAKYFECLADNTHDSLMGVKRIQTFLWNQDGPMFDRSQVKWPFTQSIDPVYEVDSTVFIVNSELSKLKNDRIGSNPFMFENDSISSFDIDYPGQFASAEKLQLINDMDGNTG